VTISARYENGVLRPLQVVRMQEGTVINIEVPSEIPATRPQSIGDLGFAGMWKNRRLKLRIPDYS
jgi:hypothetical protein